MASASSLLGFQHYTQAGTHTHTHTLGMTPLDEWSAWRRGIYLTTHSTHTQDRYSCPWRNSNTQSQRATSRRPTPWTARRLRPVSTVICSYRDPDKSLARPDWKKQLKGRHFSSDAEVIAAAETWLDGQSSDYFFLSGLQKLEFGRCSLFPSWSG